MKISSKVSGRGCSPSETMQLRFDARSYCLMLLVWLLVLPTALLAEGSTKANIRKSNDNNHEEEEASKNSAGWQPLFGNSPRRLLNGRHYQQYRPPNRTGQQYGRNHYKNYYHHNRYNNKNVAWKTKNYYYKRPVSGPGPYKKYQNAYTTWKVNWKTGNNYYQNTNWATRPVHNQPMRPHGQQRPPTRGPVYLQKPTQMPIQRPPTRMPRAPTRMPTVPTRVPTVPTRMPPVPTPPTAQNVMIEAPQCSSVGTINGYGSRHRRTRGVFWRSISNP